MSCNVALFLTGVDWTNMKQLANCNSLYTITYIPYIYIHMYTYIIHTCTIITYNTTCNVVQLISEHLLLYVLAGKTGFTVCCIDPCQKRKQTKKCIVETDNTMYQLQQQPVTSGPLEVCP